MDASRSVNERQTMGELGRDGAKIEADLRGKGTQSNIW